MTLNPSIWWLSIGSNELAEELCSLESVHAGFLKLVEKVEELSSSTGAMPPTIILQSSPEQEQRGRTGDRKTRLWNQRLQCTASLTERVQYFEFQLPQDDDDFFIDAQYSSSTTSQVGSESEQVVAKVQEYLSQERQDRF